MTSDLITSLSKLDAPDREVDAEIHALFHETIWKFEDGRKVFRDIPAYTASVDAAIALAERVLPNERVWLNRIAFDSNHQWRASLTGNHVSWGVNPAIALCIALLRAKEASNVAQTNR